MIKLAEKKSLWNIKKETCRAKDPNQGITQYVKAYSIYHIKTTGR